MTALLSIRSIFSTNRSGSTAVEFALVSVPFLLVFMAILDIGCYMAKIAVLQNAVEDAARLVKTGQVNSGSRSVFIDKISQNTFGLVDVDMLSVYVDPFNTFSQIPSSLPVPFDQNGKPINQKFLTGEGNQVVVVQVASWYHFITPMLQEIMNSGQTGLSAFASVMVFRNEPF